MKRMDITRIERRLFLSDINSEMLEKRITQKELGKYLGIRQSQLSLWLSGNTGMSLDNLIRISAEKSLSLSNRMMHIAPKSIRERLLSYFSEQAIENRSPRFSIPFSRQQLADYLGVDRSALSNELSKMQRDGLITYRKNDFLLNNLPD